MSHEEDWLIERVLSRLDDSEPLDDREPLDEGTRQVDEESLSPDDERGLREYSELSALLPFALDPVTPSAECRASILRRIRGDSRLEPAPPLSFPPPRQPGSTWRTLQLLAATLSVAVLGLGAFSAWLYTDNRRQTDRIEEIRLAMEESRQREARLQATLAEAERLSRLVMRSNARVCRLSPTGESSQRFARAAVYFDTEEREYYLTARDLSPCSEGYAYRLWFLVDGKAIQGQSFNVRAGVPVGVGSRGMPEGTTAMMVTYQRVDTSEPSGERILFGDESEEML
jgi:hypothetical protein